MFSLSLFSSPLGNNPATAQNLTGRQSPKRLFSRFFGAVFLAFSCLLGAESASANDAEELVAESRYTLSSLLADKEFAPLRRYLQKARGVLIIPQLIKAGFFFAGEGGSGVMLVKRPDGSWSQPAFYTLAAGSVGLQFGGEVKGVVFTLMNDGAVEAMLNNEVKLGVDLSVTVGPFGRGVEASATTNFGKDVYAFSHSVGLFSGGSFEGAKLFEREGLNEIYYGKGTTPRAIVHGDRFSNPQSQRLRNGLQ